MAVSSMYLCLDLRCQGEGVSADSELSGLFLVCLFGAKKEGFLPV